MLLNANPNRCQHLSCSCPRQVYAVTLYVEADRAAKELGIRSRGGFFEDATVDDYAIAVSDGAFAKVLQVQLVRNVDGPQFYQVNPHPRSQLLVISCQYAYSRVVVSFISKLRPDRNVADNQPGAHLDPEDERLADLESEDG